MTAKLGILIEAFYKGKGADQAKKDLDALGNAANEAGIKQAAMAQRSGLLSQKINQLGKEVFEGSKTTKQAAAEFENYKRSLPTFETQQAATNTQGYIGTLKGVIATGAAVAGTLYTVKKAFDMGAAGAQVDQIEESFDRLNDTTWKTPDLLDKMRAASRGTIDDLTLQKGLLTLTAGASEELSSALAGATPKLLEIAKASNKLNPSLGSTAFLYDSLALGIKRSSPMILDNLGLTIKIGEANEKFARSIGKTVDELTAQEKQQALLNATLEAGDVLIEQVGGNVDSATDSYEQLAAEAANLKTELLSLANDAIGPISQGLATNIRDTRSAQGAFNDLKDVVKELGIDKHFLAEANIEVANTTFGAAKQVEILTKVMEMLERGVRGTGEELVGYAQAERAAEQRAIALNAAAAAGQPVFETEVRLQDELNDKLAQRAAKLSEAEIATRGHQAALVAEQAALEAEAAMFGTLASAMGTSIETIKTWSDETIEAQLQALAMKSKLGELQQKVEDGELTWYEAIQQAQEYANKLGYIGDAIAMLPDHKQITIQAVFEGNAVNDLLHGSGGYEGTIGGSGNGGSGYTPPPNGGAPPGTGGETPDYFPAGGASQQSAGGTGISVVIDARGAGAGAAAEIESAVRRALYDAGRTADSRARRG